MRIKTVSVADATMLANFHQENIDHLSPWEPEKNLEFYSKKFWKKLLKQRVSEQSRGSDVYFIAICKNRQKIIATCSITGIYKGAFMAGFIGFSVDHRHEGKGAMKSLCRHVICYAFSELNLNRVIAAHMPSNTRSANLLKSLGFEREGYAKKYLNINGAWEDHILLSLVNPRTYQSTTLSTLPQQHYSHQILSSSPPM